MIVSNQIRCRKCGDTIYSAFRHDMKYCKCGAVSVDGGSGYLKRGGDPDDIEEQSIIIDDELAELFFEAAKQSEAANKNHIGAILAALRVLRDNGYGMPNQDMNLNVQQMRTLPVHGNFTQDSELWGICHEVAVCGTLPMEVRLEALAKMNELTGEGDPCDEDALIEYLKDAL